jgi:hypothetical protein
MKPRLLILLCIICAAGSSFAQLKDTCKRNSQVAIENNEGFDYNVRLDNASKDYLRLLLDSVDYKFSYDYSGNLSNPRMLFSEVDFSNFDLLSTHLTFSDKNNVQRVNFSPFRLFEKIDNSLLRNTKLNIALKNNITTFGVGLGGDNSDPKLKKRREKWIAKIKKSSFVETYEIPEDYPKDCQEKIRQKNARIASQYLYMYDSIRTKSVFKWSAGYSVQLFGILSNKGDNALADSLNYFGLKANILTLNCSYGINNGQVQVSGTYNNIKSRQSAVKGQKKILYHGFQFSGSYRLLSFLKGNKLKTSENFIKSLFVPSLNIGVSYDYKYTKGEVIFIEDGIQKSRTIMPFIDILLSPASGFKLGFPFTRNRSVIDAKTLQLGAVIQYSFKLVNLN